MRWRFSFFDGWQFLSSAGDHAIAARLKVPVHRTSLLDDPFATVGVDNGDFLTPVFVIKQAYHQQAAEGPLWLHDGLQAA